MEVIAIEPFTAKAKDGEYRVHTFERLTVLSGFQIMKLKTSLGDIVICPERYLYKKLVKVEDFPIYRWKLYAGYERYWISAYDPDKDFLKAEDMVL